MPIDSWFDQVVPEAEARGRAIGEQDSERRMQQLWNAMRDDNRADDFLAAINDTAFLHQLYDEYGINDPVNSDLERVV